MTVNFITLAIAFQDGSMQTETAQTLRYDTFGVEPYNLNEMDFDIRVIAMPPIPSRIGSF